MPLDLPANWLDSDALALTATDPTGRVVTSWMWRIKKATDFTRRLVVPIAGSVTATETSTSITMTAGTTKVTIGKSNGRLTGVTRAGATVSLTNGPAPADGTATFTGLSHFRDGTGWVVQANYTGDLTSARWRLDSNGWLQLEYSYRRTGNHDYFGWASTTPRRTCAA
ncbi:hypothetical protein NKG94_50515 [Micromonospora sp. M12]